MEEIEDYYTYYVMILGLDEMIFWYADISFIKQVISNKLAYDNWIDYAREEVIKNEQ